MPDPAPRACYTCGRANCDAHKRKAWSSKTGTGTRRIRGAKLQRIREDLLRREPWCRACRQAGIYTPAVIVDHITPLGEGGDEAAINRQPLCKAHSDAKTREESQRGLARRRRPRGLA